MPEKCLDRQNGTKNARFGAGSEGFQCGENIPRVLFLLFCGEISYQSLGSWGVIRRNRETLHLFPEELPDAFQGKLGLVSTFQSFHLSADSFDSESIPGAVSLPVQMCQKLRCLPLTLISQAEPHIDPILVHPITPAFI